MIAAFKLVLADLRSRTALVVGATLLVMGPLAGFILLHGFARNIEVNYQSVERVDLIVQESNSVGEVTGSRIDASIEADLIAMGANFAIPEIHAVAGSSADNAVLIRGLDLDRYLSITEFEVVEGRRLKPGDPPTSVMIGVDLATNRGLGVGEALLLRNRPFEVVGVFEVGTYADNEAWLSLDGARTLLGWGHETSIFVVPDGGPLREGDVLDGPLSVARRGDFVDLLDEWDPIFALAGVANVALSTASAVILAVVLWRLAWLRRRELAVLRAIGMGRRVPLAYLGLEGALIATTALVGAIAAATVMGSIIRVDAMGLTSQAVLDGTSIVRGAVLTAAILGVAVGMAALRVLRAQPATMLRAE